MLMVFAEIEGFTVIVAVPAVKPVVLPHPFASETETNV